MVYFMVCFGLMLMESNAPISIPNSPKEINMLKVLQVISSTLIFILPATVFCRVLRPERNAFLQMNSAPHFYFAITAVACIFFAFPAVSGLESWNSHLHLPGMNGTEEWMRLKENQAEKITLMFFEDRSVTGLLINIFVMGFIAALSEEVFFRGLLQQIMIKNRINPHAAIIITAILFSAFHLQFFGFIPRLFLGIVLGYLYYLTQNLWVSIIGHFFNNSFAVVAMYLYGEDITSSPASAGSEVNILLVLLSLVMVSAQLIMLNRYIKKVNARDTKPDL